MAQCDGLERHLWWDFGTIFVGAMTLGNRSELR